LTDNANHLRIDPNLISFDSLLIKGARGISTGITTYDELIFGTLAKKSQYPPPRRRDLADLFFFVYFKEGTA